MQMRLNSGGIDCIMAENTIENGELYQNNGNISTKSGDISQQNKKHILLSFCYVNIIIFLCITSTCQDLILFYSNYADYHCIL